MIGNVKRNLMDYMWRCRMLYDIYGERRPMYVDVYFDLIIMDKNFHEYIPIWWVRTHGGYFCVRNENTIWLCYQNIFTQWVQDGRYSWRKFFSFYDKIFSIFYSNMLSLLRSQGIPVAFLEGGCFSIRDTINSKGKFIWRVIWPDTQGNFIREKFLYG